MTADVAQEKSFAKQAIATSIGDALECAPPGSASATISASQFSAAWRRQS
jgi:hypothetical protein